MEESTKNSFYNFLLANSKPVARETSKVKRQYLIIAWMVLFLINVLVVWFGWNYSVSPIFDLSTISFAQSVLLYSIAKALSRGFFSL
jgi:hypothetical protein